jgi:hypothetical protein
MMRTFITATLLSIVFLGCDVRKTDKLATNTAGKDSMKTTLQMPSEPTTVQIIDSVYDFGQVTDGDVVEYSFRFKNTGTQPLVVTNVAASCGCTVPEKPEQPIKPGETGFIKAKFNSAGRVGTAMKTITVTSNAAPAFPQLVLKGNVMSKKEN